MARTTHSSSRVAQVFFPLLDELNLLDLAGPAHVFQSAESFGFPYRLRFCATGAQVTSSLGLHLCKLERLTDAEPQRGDLVFIPGAERTTLDHSATPELINWLNRAHRRGATLCSVCTGAFVLAKAGLLDGRRSTTHWSRIGDLRTAAPKSLVEGDVLFLEDKNIYTSAGVSAGIDLALFILESHHGPLVATRVARELVVYLRRDGRHAQTSVYLDYRNHIRAGVHRVQDWLIRNPERRATLPELAKIAALSPRHLSRVFRTATGVTIGRYATLLRLDRAHSLGANPEMTQSAIAAECGLRDARQLRRIRRQSRFETCPGQ